MDKELMRYRSTQAKAEKLRVYAELEGSELGELCRGLIEMVSPSELAGVGFRKALEKEITEQLEWFEENTGIVEHTETTTHTYKELVFEE